MIEWYWLILLMVFAHSIADYHIQGCLADLKQEDWWYSHPKYKHKYHLDYIPALLFHSLEWSVIVHIPLIWVYGFDSTIFVLILFNMVIHAYVDNLKCNDEEINLVQDQFIHLVQICFSMLIVLLVGML